MNKYTLITLSLNVLTMGILFGHTKIQNDITESIIDTFDSQSHRISIIQDRVDQLESQPEPVENNLELIPLGTFKVTAYCDCEECQGEWVGQTAAGVAPTVGRTVAVDPDVIPLGTRLIIGDHIYTAEDVGGAIKGNRIDVFMSNHDEAKNFGVQKTEVYKWTTY